MYKDDFIGMLEDRGEKPEPMPVYQLTSSRGAVLKVQIEKSEIFNDDLTGQLLPPDLVKAPRRLEIEYFNGKAVREKRPLGEARHVTGKPPITGRWFDVAKRLRVRCTLPRHCA